eukprot:362807-Rhodomonas_salina.1
MVRGAPREQAVSSQPLPFAPLACVGRDRQLQPVLARPCAGQSRFSLAQSESGSRESSDRDSLSWNQRCSQELGKHPNFIAVDFHSFSDIFEVVNTLNAETVSTLVEVSSSSSKLLSQPVVVTVPAPTAGAHHHRTPPPPAPPRAGTLPPASCNLNLAAVPGCA